MLSERDGGLDCAGWSIAGEAGDCDDEGAIAVRRGESYVGLGMAFDGVDGGTG